MQVLPDLIEEKGIHLEGVKDCRECAAIAYEHPNVGWCFGGTKN